GSQRVTIPEMVRVGLALNVIGAVVITVVFYVVGTNLFGIEPGVLPDWAMAPPDRR
ncbi:MAG: anion transporter, partial [Myxococcales bacterium]|nr:anion transporter [Myxococcales bacterium]NNL25096.1 anion transporter [Myxococcales bacterium]